MQPNTVATEPETALRPATPWRTMGFSATVIMSLYARYNIEERDAGIIEHCTKRMRIEYTYLAIAQGSALHAQSGKHSAWRIKSEMGMRRRSLCPTAASATPPSRPGTDTRDLSHDRGRQPLASNFETRVDAP